MSRKALFRLPIAICDRIRANKKSKSRKINAEIEKSINRFYLEIVPEGFRELAVAGIDKIHWRELSRAHDLARDMGIIFPRRREKNIPVGTVLSDETLSKLKVIAAWSKTRPSQALQVCLAYSLKFLDAPNRYRGDINRMISPLLEYPYMFSREEFRAIVEDDIPS